MLGYNMFAYCNNNPANFYDPTGQSTAALLWGWLTSAGTVAVAEPTPIGEIVLVVGAIIISGIWLVEELQELGEVINDKTSDPPKSITEPEDNPTEIDDSAASLPQQGKVTAVPDAPYVDAGNQGKHVVGHKNNTNPNKSTWKKGENGVRQTQEAWKNSRQVGPNIKIGISKDGRTIRIHFGKKGIHGYPIFPK